MNEKIVFNKENFNEALILLGAVKKLLKKQEDSNFKIDLLAELVKYDDIECDGLCLLNDISDFLEGR